MSAMLSEFIGKPLRDIIGAIQPNKLDVSCAGGVIGCPMDYAGFDDSYRVCPGVDTATSCDCNKCWSQIYQGNRDCEENDEESEIITLRELADALVRLCDTYPEIADCEVNVTTECGYSSAGVAKPVRLYKRRASSDLIHLHTTDDSITGADVIYIAEEGELE